MTRCAPRSCPGDLETISTPIDTLGVNYYHGEFVGGHAPAVPPMAGDAPTDRRGESPFPSSEGIFWHERGLPRTPMNWEVQPEGLTRLLVRVLGGVRRHPPARRCSSPRTARRTTTSR